MPEPCCFPVNLAKFLRNLFYRTPLDDYFWYDVKFKFTPEYSFINEVGQEFYEDVHVTFSNILLQNLNFIAYV